MINSMTIADFSVSIGGDPFHGSSLDILPEYLPLIPLLTTVFLTAAAHRKLLYQSAAFEKR